MESVSALFAFLLFNFLKFWEYLKLFVVNPTFKCWSFINSQYSYNPIRILMCMVTYWRTDRVHISNIHNIMNITEDSELKFVIVNSLSPF